MNADPKNLEALQTVIKCFCAELAMVVQTGAGLWLLLKRRDVWLRWTAAEAAFYVRLHLPAKFISSNRKFSEGRIWVYIVAGLFVFSMVALVFAA
jgi:hypothetical protein